MGKQGLVVILQAIGQGHNWEQLAIDLPDQPLFLRWAPFPLPSIASHGLDGFIAVNGVDMCGFGVFDMLMFMLKIPLREAAIGLCLG